LFQKNNNKFEESEYKMKHKDVKKIVLISFFDRICLSTRLLSSELKKSGHDVFLLFLKDDRSRKIDNIHPTAEFHQYIFNNQFHGCGIDVNPVTENEFNIVVSKVVEIKPDVVGISSRSVTLELAEMLVNKLKKVLPEARYIGGGFGPSLEPEKFLRFLDYVCVGEGEKVISQLITSENPSDVNNVAFLEDDTLKINLLCEPVKLDDISYPDWTNHQKFMVEDNLIQPIQKCFDSKTYDIFTTRGCPNTCTYCMASHFPAIYRDSCHKMPRIRSKSPEVVIEELKYAKTELGVKYVRFKDSIFGYNKKWLNSFLKLYDKEIALPFNCYIEPKFNSEESVKRLKESGLNFSTVGIQAVDQDIRSNIMGRKESNDELIEYAHMVADNGIGIQYDIIHWNPFDTIQTLERGIEFLKKFPKGEDTCVFQLKFYPGSRLFALWSEHKPEPLNADEYEFFAWIYQMILYSDKTEKLAEFLLKYKSFKEHPRLLKNVFDEEIGRLKDLFKVSAARDIQKGEVITNVMIKKYKSSQTDAVNWDNKNVILSHIAAMFIKKDSLITSDAYFGQYETKS